MDQILKKYEIVFKKGLGTVQGVIAKIHVESHEEVRYMYFKSRPPPFAQEDIIKQEFDRLDNEGTVTIEKFSQ